MNDFNATVTDRFAFTNISDHDKQELKSSDTTPNNQLKVAESSSDSDDYLDVHPVICQELSWSKDGSKLTSVSSDRVIRRYIISRESTTELPSLSLYSQFSKNQSIVTSVVSPSDSHILLCSRNLPIQLYPLEPPLDEPTLPENIPTDPSPVYSYSTTNGQTEAFETPYSARFLSPWQFITGSVRNSVSLYDIERREPLWQWRSDKLKCGRAAYKAIVSCFEEQCIPVDGNSSEHLNSNILHFGTYKNEIYRADLRTAIGRRAIKPLDLVQQNNKQGNGIYQILRSDNGMYLYALKRQSDEIEVYDTRKLSTVVSRLRIPFKVRNQKFKASLSSYNGLCIGTTHGTMETWDRSLVESGGISRNAIENCDLNGHGQDGIPPTTSTSINWGSSNQETDTPTSQRINIVKQNPENPYMAAISYSPDKNDKLSYQAASDNSGICIVESL